MMGLLVPRLLLFVGSLALFLMAALPAQAQSPEMSCGQSGVLQGEDAVPLFDTPENRVVRFTLPVGRVVRVLGSAQWGAKHWCLVSPLDSYAQGWVSTDSFTRAEQVGPHFANFQSCAGNRARPSRTCGASLPLSDGIWLRWEYSGLRPGDQVQRLLEVNGERYQLPVVTWKAAGTGQQLANLLAEHRPRPEKGEWRVWFIVNGQVVAQTTFQVR